MRALLLLALAPACSLGTYDYTACSSNLECRDAFGFANVCNADGYCEAAPGNDRCSETWPTDLLSRPENYTGNYIIGSLYDHSTDVPETLATQLPIIEVNDYGGLEGHDFAMIQCDYAEDLDVDDLGADDAAAAGAVYLAETIGVAAIIGPATSSQSQTVWNALHNDEMDADVVIISPSATSTSLTRIDGVSPSDDDPGLFWRTAPPDDLQGKVIAGLVTDSGANRVVALHEDGPYGQGLYEAFDQNYAGDSTELTFADQSSMIESLTTSTEGYDAVLFFAGDVGDIAAFLNAAASLDYYEEMPIFLSDAARDVDLLAEASSASALFPNITGTAPGAVSGDVYDAFDAAYGAQYEPDSSASDSSYTPYCFDATWLALYGTAWSYYNEDAVGGTGIARGLRHVSNPDVDAEDEVILRPTSWANLIANAQAAADINVLGASGELDYDPATGETSGPIDIWTIAANGDEFVTDHTEYP
jgi:branched-chain amino acid transport system substrate-binding protein